MEKTDLKIMIVDDSEMARTSTKDILEQEGYEVVATVGNAQEALKLSFELSPNLFIIDVVMPQVSGLELAESIVNNFMDAKVIMMSSLDIETVCIDSISTGAQDFLVKPFKKEDLLKSVEKMMHDMIQEQAS
ncbi:response regulator [Halobacteriovorax sp.]|uniref:response regulator n=1 Tax=Halobacteriovorax sp. TaxID=2020862 RepID=UPI003AF2EF0D